MAIYLFLYNICILLLGKSGTGKNGTGKNSTVITAPVIREQMEK